MSANPEVTAIGKTPALQANQAFVVGRVSEVRKTEKAVYTIVKTPAPDAYTHPGQHELVSSRIIGKPGEDVRVCVQLAGYGRTYKDKKTGDDIRTVDNTLRVIED